MTEFLQNLAVTADKDFWSSACSSLRFKKAVTLKMAEGGMC